MNFRFVAIALLAMHLAFAQDSNETSTEAFGNEAPSIKDLEDSFGGTNGVESTESLPTAPNKKTNGFFFLFDWHTFLDIDDTVGRRVNLRFEPVVGDPSQFYASKDFKR